MEVYPLVICYIAIENGPVEIVDLPMNSIGIFQFANCKRLPGRVVAPTGSPIGHNWIPLQIAPNK